jgi:hypothetical protein
VEAHFQWDNRYKNEFLEGMPMLQVLASDVLYNQLETIGLFEQLGIMEYQRYDAQACKEPLLAFALGLDDEVLQAALTACDPQKTIVVTPLDINVALVIELLKRGVSRFVNITTGNIDGTALKIFLSQVLDKSMVEKMAVLKENLRIANLQLEHAQAEADVHKQTSISLQETLRVRDLKIRDLKGRLEQSETVLNTLRRNILRHLEEVVSLDFPGEFSVVEETKPALTATLEEVENHTADLQIGLSFEAEQPTEAVAVEEDAFENAPQQEVITVTFEEVPQLKPLAETPIVEEAAIDDAQEPQVASLPELDDLLEETVNLDDELEVVESVEDELLEEVSDVIVEPEQEIEPEVEVVDCQPEVEVTGEVLVEAEPEPEIEEEVAPEEEDAFIEPVVEVETFEGDLLDLPDIDDLISEDPTVPELEPQTQHVEKTSRVKGLFKAFSKK